MNVQEVAQAVRERHGASISRKSADGNIRSIEILWQVDNQRVHGMKVPAFTDRERGNIKYLIEQLGADEAAFLLREAIEHWGFLRSHLSLSALPPTPTFGALFAYRETLRSYLHDRGKVVVKKTSAVEKIKQYEKEAVDKVPAKMSLTEMVKAARKEIANGK